jgi:anti-sigma factor RsiW
MPVTGGSRVTDAEAPDVHLTPEQSAGYLDGVLTRDERTVVEAHLAVCSECRDEVVALRPVVSRREPRRSVLRAVAVASAVAAAVVLLLLPPRVSGPELSAHRDLQNEDAPTVVPRVPAGEGLRPVLLAWSPLAQASRYRVQVFDAEGSVLFRAEAADSALRFPDSVALSPGRPYFWKVEADTGWDRWVSSGLVEFSIAPGREAGP